MSLQINKIKTTSIQLPFTVSNKEVPVIDEKKEFHEARNGRWSGTVVKKLMACSSKGGKMSWADPEKITQFSKSIEKAMQRKTGKHIESGGTNEMKYGTRVEPLILAIGGEKIKSFFNEEIKIEEVKFKSFPDFPNAGATSDSVARNAKTNKVLATVEAKGCTNWSTHYKRTYELMDEKDMDFWQTQTQCKAWEVDNCYYLVAEPPKDITKYLYYDGDIMDLKNEFQEECAISVQIVESSPFHQNAIMQRIIIAEKALNKWLELGGRVDDIFYNEIESVDLIDTIMIEEVDTVTRKPPPPIPPKARTIIEELPEDLPF